MLPAASAAAAAGLGACGGPRQPSHQSSAREAEWHRRRCARRGQIHTAAWLQLHQHASAAVQMQAPRHHATTTTSRDRSPPSSTTTLPQPGTHLADVRAVGLAVLVPVAGQLEQALVRVVPRAAHRRNVLQRRVCGTGGQSAANQRVARAQGHTTTPARSTQHLAPPVQQQPRATPGPHQQPRHEHTLPPAPVRPYCSCRSRR